MKKNLFLIATAAMIMMTGCSKEGTTMTVDGKEVPAHIEKAFQAKYPNATNVVWKKSGAYTVVNFDLNKTATKAASSAANTNTLWFDDTANCKMEELNINPSELPQPIQDAFKANAKYAGCHIDDIDLISREGYESVYVLEVEGKTAEGAEIDVDLYYTKEGVLLRELPDSPEDDDDEKYETLISDVDMEKFNAFLTQKYGEFQLIEADVEDNGTFEIEIVATREGTPVEIEVIFDKDAKFLYEEAEVDFEKADQKLQDYITANYQDAEVEEIEIRTYADNTVKYVFEYETTVDGNEVEVEVLLQINAEGNVEVVK